MKDTINNTILVLAAASGAALFVIAVMVTWAAIATVLMS